MKMISIENIIAFNQHLHEMQCSKPHPFKDNFLLVDGKPYCTFCKCFLAPAICNEPMFEICRRYEYKHLDEQYEEAKSEDTSFNTWFNFAYSQRNQKTFPEYLLSGGERDRSIYKNVESERLDNSWFHQYAIWIDRISSYPQLTNENIEQLLQIQSNMSAMLKMHQWLEEKRMANK